MISDELREIAAQLRQIALELEGSRLGIVDAATYAGRLMLEAMQRGLFSESQWLGLRQVIEMATRGELDHQLGHPPGTRNAGGSLSPPLPWHAFVNGCVWLLRDSREPAGPFNDALVKNGSALIARHIDGMLEQLGSETAGSGQPPDGGSDRWLRLIDAERITAITRGTLSRAADRGDIRDNGKTGDQRRIDAVSLCRYALKRSAYPEPTESDAHAQKLVDKHVS